MRTSRQHRLLYHSAPEAQKLLLQNHPEVGVARSHQAEVEVEVVLPGEVRTVAVGHNPMRMPRTVPVPGAIPSVGVERRPASLRAPDARQSKDLQPALLREPLVLPRVL